MVQAGLVWVLLVSGLVLVLSFDERPDLNHNEDLLHPSSTSDTENWEVFNVDHDRTQDRHKDEDQDQTRDQTQHENTSLCGDFSSEETPDGRCLIRATLPVGSGSLQQERCPDLFRCRTEASDWSREAGDRKQQLQQVQDVVNEMKQEIQEHQRRVKHLEIQSEGHVIVNSSVIGRLRALELHHSEVSTLLHVHAALMHEIQTQVQNLNKTLRTSCTQTHPRPVSMIIKTPSRPAGSLGSCPSDCASLIQNGVHRSGIYSIVVAPGVSLPVYCDMETDGGGWTVFQRRRDGSVSFNRGWDQYRVGFGDLRTEFWLGNTPLHLLVTQRRCSLRIHLLDWAHVHHHALYQDFKIEDEQSRFRLHVSGFSGSISDSFGWYHDGQDFGTPDTGDLCAEVCHSGWWFRQCYQANLNGVYYQGGLYSLRAQNLLSPDGLVWFSWADSDFYSLKSSSMMVRPLDFRSHRSP